jgi:hypothetical protein
MTMQRRDLLKSGLAIGAAVPDAGLAFGAAIPPAQAQSSAQTLRIGMTTSDLPTTGGIPDNGSEGGRFAGYTIYDALVNWDFTNTDAFADLTPQVWQPNGRSIRTTICAGFSRFGRVSATTTARR